MVNHSSPFNSKIDSIDLTQHVKKTTHCFSHTLDLALTYGIDIEHVIIFPQNPILPDHVSITFEFIV